VKVLDEADELRKLRAQADRRTAALIPALFHDIFGDTDENPKGLPVLPFGELLAEPLRTAFLPPKTVVIRRKCLRCQPSQVKSSTVQR
jgi:type I restriction enzyme S subunit